MDGHESLRVRRGRLLAVYALCCLPFIGYGAWRALQTNSNSPLTWVPPSFAPRAEYDQNVERFGSGEVVIASWPGCTFEEPRLNDLLKSLREDADFKTADSKSYFERITCGREIINGLTTGPTPIRRERAINRFRGSLVGKDDRQTCVVIAFTQAGLDDRDRLITAIQRHISDRFAIGEDEIHLAGPVIDGWSVDRAGRASMDRLAPISAGIMLLLACLCLRSLRDGLIVFGLSLFCLGATLAVVHFSGEPMNALLIVLPPLIQVLAIAGGIHLTNYYRDSLPAHGPKEAPWQAVRMGWLPCLLSSGTTALGIGSLMASRLTPIRSFGVFGSFGVLLIFGLMMIAIPAVWLAWPRRSQESDNAAQRNSERGLSDVVTRGMTRMWPAVLIAAAVAILGCGYFLQSLTTSVRIETLFTDDSRILRDYRWLEEHVGPLVAVDVVVSWPMDDSASITRRLKRLWEIQKSVAAEEEVGGSVSALQLFPALPPPMAAHPDQYEKVVNQILDRARPEFAAAGFLHENKDREYWRISVRTSATSPTDYRDTLQRLRNTVARQIEADAESATMDVQYTGVMPLVQEVQSQLMRDLLHSALGAVAVIAIVMTLAQGGLFAGLVAMIPNVFPIVILFGVLGWRGQPIDIGTVMTASVALGIAVDDTLHFLTFFQRAVTNGSTRPDAVRFAYRHCAKAMIQTSVVCGLGLLVFGFADFLPTSRFAWMMSVLITLALVGDLCVLPAILLSPLGRLFAADSATLPSAGDDAADIARSNVPREAA